VILLIIGLTGLSVAVAPEDDFAFLYIFKGKDVWNGVWATKVEPAAS
jgi:hypothetical protein